MKENYNNVRLKAQSLTLYLTQSQHHLCVAAFYVVDFYVVVF